MEGESDFMAWPEVWGGTYASSSQLPQPAGAANSSPIVLGNANQPRTSSVRLVASASARQLTSAESRLPRPQLPASATR